MGFGLSIVPGPGPGVAEARTPLSFAVLNPNLTRSLCFNAISAHASIGAIILRLFSELCLVGQLSKYESGLFCWAGGKEF